MDRERALREERMTRLAAAWSHAGFWKRLWLLGGMACAWLRQQDEFETARNHWKFLW